MEFGHNLENAMAAAAIAIAAGVPLDIIKDVLKTFKGVEHRIEYCGTIGGVTFYNDSKATNVDSAIKALEAIDKPILLIGGGKDKNVDFGQWVKLFENKVKFIALMGETAEQIIETCKIYSFMNYDKVNSLKSAVELCFSKAKDGDCVLLSPACASLDMFDNYEQRGDLFKMFVSQMRDANASRLS